MSTRIIEPSQFETPVEALKHYGVKGMRWGERKRTISSARRKTGKLADDVDAKEAAYVNAKRSGSASKTAKAAKDLQDASLKEDKNLLTASTLTRGEQIAAVLIAGPIGAAIVAGNAKGTSDKVKPKGHSKAAFRRLDQQAAKGR